MSIQKNKTGRWSFRKRVRLPDGTRRRVFGTPGIFGLPNTKAATDEALRRSIAMLLDGIEADSSVTKRCPTLAEFSTVAIASSKVSNKSSFSSQKKNTFRKYLIPLLGNKRLSDITFTEIEKLKHKLVAKVKPKTANNVLSILRTTLSLAEKHGHIKSVPSFEWLRCEKPGFDFLDFDEAERLYDATAPEWQAMVLVAMRTGLRLGELIGLRWEDVDLKKGRILVRQAIVEGRVTTPKSNKSREVGLSEDAWDALRHYRHLKGPLVFCQDNGRQFSKSKIGAPITYACKVAGLRKIRGWHTLRHTFASHLVMNGVSLRTVQELMGHAKIETTMIYAHLAPHVAREAVKTLGFSTQKKWPKNGQKL